MASASRFSEIRRLASGAGPAGAAGADKALVFFLSAASRAKISGDGFLAWGASVCNAGELGTGKAAGCYRGADSRACRCARRPGSSLMTNTRAAAPIKPGTPHHSQAGLAGLCALSLAMTRERR